MEGHHSPFKPEGEQPLHRRLGDFPDGDDAPGRYRQNAGRRHAGTPPQILGLMVDQPPDDQPPDQPN